MKLYALSLILKENRLLGFVLTELKKILNVGISGLVVIFLFCVECIDIYGLFALAAALLTNRIIELLSIHTERGSSCIKEIYSLRFCFFDNVSSLSYSSV